MTTQKNNDTNINKKNIQEIPTEELKALYIAFRREVIARKLDHLLLEELSVQELFVDHTILGKRIIELNTHFNRPENVRRELIQKWSAGAFDKHGVAGTPDEGKAIITMERIEDFIKDYTTAYEYAIVRKQDTQSIHDSIMKFKQYIWFIEDQNSPEKKEEYINKQKAMREAFLAQQKALSAENTNEEIKH